MSPMSPPRSGADSGSGPRAGPASPGARRVGSRRCRYLRTSRPGTPTGCGSRGRSVAGPRDSTFVPGGPPGSQVAGGGAQAGRGSGCHPSTSFSSISWRPSTGGAPTASYWFWTCRPCPSTRTSIRRGRPFCRYLRRLAEPPRILERRRRGERHHDDFVDARALRTLGPGRVLVAVDELRRTVGAGPGPVGLDELLVLVRLLFRLPGGGRRSTLLAPVNTRSSPCS